MEAQRFKWNEQQGSNMSEGQNPTESIRALKQTLRDLQQMPRRVQVRQVLPLIHDLTKLGFPIAELAGILTDAGVAFKPASLKQALYLWRKKQSTRHG